MDLKTSIFYHLSDLETLIHLLNVLLPSVLWFSFEIYEGGLVFGLLATILAGVVWLHCIHTLLKCSHELHRRTNSKKQPYNMGDIAALAFSYGPCIPWLARFVVNGTLITYLIFSCTAQIAFIFTSMKNSIEHFVRNDDNESSKIDQRVYYLVAIIPLIFISMINNLKKLLPISLIGNIFLITGFGIVSFFDFLYLKMNYPAMREYNLPKLFGYMLLAFEGVDAVVFLQNKMRNPSRLLGFRGLLDACTAIVVYLSAIIGFFGYFDLPFIQFERLDKK